MIHKLLNATTFFLVLIILVVSITAGMLYMQLRTDSVSALLTEDPRLNALVVAHDGTEPFLSFLIFYDDRTNRAAVLDIPNSVGAVLHTIGRVDGIDAVFDPDDPEPYRRQVESMTGVSIPLVFTYERDNLVDFIDLMGGMELFIISDYRELGGSDPVLMPSGSTRLDGAKSVSYLHQPGERDLDLEQVGRRQAFVQSFLRELGRNAEFLRHSDVIPVRDRMIKTSVESRGISTFIRALGTINPDRIVRRRIQGTVRQVEVNGTPRNLLFPHFEGEWLKQSVQQIRQTLTNPDGDFEEETLVALEVLNGTARTGLARRTSELFESFGFQVHSVGNAETSDIEHTLVVDRRGIGDLAQRVADVIDGRRVVTEIRPESEVDVTVILGGDFDGTRVRSDGQ